jgi:hypothetical protein
VVHDVGLELRVLSYVSHLWSMASLIQAPIHEIHEAVKNKLSHSVY